MIYEDSDIELNGLHEPNCPGYGQRGHDCFSVDGSLEFWWIGSEAYQAPDPIRDYSSSTVDWSSIAEALAMVATKMPNLDGCLQELVNLDCEDWDLFVSFFVPGHGVQGNPDDLLSKGLLTNGWHRLYYLACVKAQLIPIQLDLGGGDISDIYPDEVGERVSGGDIWQVGELNRHLVQMPDISANAQWKRELLSFAPNPSRIRRWLGLVSRSRCQSVWY